MSDDLFDPPGQSDKVDFQHLLGRLILVKPLEYKTDVLTKDYGAKDAIEADIHVLDGPANGEYSPGAVFHSAYIFPMVMIGQIKSGVGSGRFNLGRVEQGKPTKGKPPWQLADPTDADKELARKYLASDRYKQNERSAPAPQPAAAPPASDPWGSAPAPAAQVAAPAAGPWGSDEPPF